MTHTSAYPFYAYPISTGPLPEHHPKQLSQVCLGRSDTMSAPCPALSQAEEGACLGKFLLHFLAGLALPELLLRNNHPLAP